MSQTKETLKVVKSLQKVVEGKVGWYSLTTASKNFGLDRFKLELIAVKMGLKIVGGGRHGICAVKE